MRMVTKDISALQAHIVTIGYSVATVLDKVDDDDDNDYDATEKNSGKREH